MKPTAVLMTLSILVILSAATWWTIDSIDYGSPVFYSRESKAVQVTEVDPVFGTEVTVTQYQPGPWFGLLDLAFPFGALPMSAFGMVMISASGLLRRRTRRAARLSTATMAVLLLAVTGATSATSLKNISPGVRSVTLNDAVRKSEVRFESHAPLEDIIGSAGTVSGTFRIDPTNLEATTGRFVVPVSSMRTGMSKRDQHMRDDDWLDAEKYPEISYEVESLRDVRVLSSSGGKTTVQATATGSFTMHGVSRTLDATVTMTYVTETPETKKRASGDLVMIEASFTVPWKEYGVKGRKSFNDKVSQQIQVSVSLYGNTQS